MAEEKRCPFRIGEHHRVELLDSALIVILAAAAARAMTIGISIEGQARCSVQDGQVKQIDLVCSGFRPEEAQR